MHLLIQAELDGELDAAGVAKLFSHLGSCSDCTALHEELGLVSARLRQGGLTRYSAPATLRAAVAAKLPNPTQRERRTPVRRSWGQGGTHAASFGTGLAVAAAVSWLIVVPGRPGAVPNIVAAHLRALQPGHLLDVPSSDQHTVKPWFNGRLDFSPSAPNLAGAGFPLLGGRLDYLDGRPVAVLVYGRDKHLIDVFVRPSGPADPAGAVQGYNVQGWMRDGMRYTAISDLNPAELAAFARMMVEAGTAR